MNETVYQVGAKTTQRRYWKHCKLTVPPYEDRSRGSKDLQTILKLLSVINSFMLVAVIVVLLLEYCEIKKMIICDGVIKQQDS